MKTKIFLLFAILIYTNFAQTWQKLSPIPTSEQVERLYFYDANLGFGGASSGFAIRTSDGGNTWTEVSVSSYYDGIHDFSFTSSSIGYACGYNKSIYKTTDGGLTWSLLTRQNNSAKGFISISFTDANTGYVVGDDGMIWKTVNAGSNWSALTSGVTYTLTKILALNSTTLLITGYGNVNNYRILKSTNSGSSWIEKNSGSPTILNDAHSPDNTNIFVCGASGRVYKSTNAGETWSELTSPNSYTPGGHLYGINFPSTQNGYVADFSGSIYKTTNGGTSWTKMSNGVPSTGFNPLTVWFTSTNNGFVSGSNGMLLKTTNQGDNWTVLNKGIASYIAGAAFTDANTGYVGDMYSTNFYKTTDGGNNWSALTTGIAGGTYDLIFVDANNGFGVSDNISFFKTTNAGTTWTNVSLSSFFTSAPYALHFPSLTTGYIVGEKAIIKTTNGGTNWTVKKNNFSQDLYSTFFVDNNTGFVAGDGGLISKTTDGGTTWTTQTTNTTSGIWSVQFFNANVGVASGVAGLLLMTTDGGTTWVDKSISTTATLYKSKFIYQNTVITCGEAGTIYVSSDGGQNWNNLSISTNASFYTCAIVGNDVWVFGDAGLIYKNTAPLPTELVSFSANVNKSNCVTLNWQTVTEVNSYRFEIERSKTLVNGNQKIEWKTLGFVDAAGNSNSVKKYSYTDNDLYSGAYIYRLKMLDIDGSYQYSSELKVNISKPELTDLKQNYPNSFNPATTIEYQLANNSRVKLELYSITGNLISTLIDKETPAGYYTYHLDMSKINVNLATGVYLYRMTVFDRATNEIKSFEKKMMFVK